MEQGKKGLIVILNSPVSPHWVVVAHFLFVRT